MRRRGLLLATVSLSACQNNVKTNEKPTVAATTLSFDGAQTSDPAAIRAHGERLSHILGCRGCHSATLQGQLFNSDTPEQGKLNASNLTRVVPTMNDAQLEALLCTRRHPDRGGLWVMPSQVFQRLSAADMAALIAHLRTVKPDGAPTPPLSFTAKGLAEIESGTLMPVAAYVAQYKAVLPPDLGAKHALGRYLAGATRSECHGRDLTGVPDFEPNMSTPDLDVAGAYSEAELTQLISTGKGKTPRNLGLMGVVGKSHFGYLTPRERSAIVGYTKARAAR